MHDNCFKIFIKPINKTKYFLFNHEKYEFNFEMFKVNSSFFFRNQALYENVETIDLLQENEVNQFKDISSTAITSFISLSQNQPCEINNSDIFYIQYLARKYEVIELSKKIADAISKNQDQLIFDQILYQHLTSQQKKDDISLFTDDDADIISSNLPKYIKDDRIFKLPISILYEIITKYFQNKSKNTNIQEENMIIEFLFRALDKIGRDASILFTLINIKDYKINILEILTQKYRNIFDFNLIGTQLLSFSIETNHENKELRRQASKVNNIIILELTNSFEIGEFPHFEHDLKTDSNEEVKILYQDAEIQNKNLFLYFSQIMIVEKLFDNIIECNFSESFESNLLQGITFIKDYAFIANQLITDVTIPSSVLSIGIYSFCRCLSLQRVLIPLSVKTIGDFAFSECRSLNQITIPSSVKNIGNSSFYGCISLQKVTIPSSVRHIGHNAFRQCSGMKEIEIDPYITNFEDNTFAECKSLDHLVFGSSVKMIKESNFERLGLLKKITIPSSVISIDNYSFKQSFNIGKSDNFAIFICDSEKCIQWLQ